MSSRRRCREGRGHSRHWRAYHNIRRHQSLQPLQKYCLTTASRCQTHPRSGRELISQVMAQQTMGQARSHREGRQCFLRISKTTAPTCGTVLHREALWD